MYYDKQKVIDWALGEVGYHEKATNAQLDDKTANSGDGNILEPGVFGWTEVVT